MNFPSYPDDRSLKVLSFKFLKEGIYKHLFLYDFYQTMLLAWDDTLQQESVNLQDGPCTVSNKA
jgi:hypothetical protein